MDEPTSVRRLLRRIAVTVAGSAVIAAGVAMLVLPGPGLVTIALGLSILGREHAWAAALEDRVRARLRADGLEVVGDVSDEELLLKGGAWRLDRRPAGWRLELVVPIPLAACPHHDRDARAR